MSTIKVRIIRDKDDPIALRISMGGREEIGYYIVYRGDPQEILDCLQTCIDAFEAHVQTEEEPEAG